MKKYPAILFAVLFISGIFVQKVLVLPIFFMVGAVISLSLILSILLNCSHCILIKGVTALFLILFLGASYLAFYNYGRQNYPFEKVKLKNVTVYGRVTGLELFREYEIRFRLMAEASSVDSLHKTKGLIFLCRIREQDKSRLDSLYPLLADGYSIKVVGAVSKGRERRNPFEFDYQKYLENSGITGLFTVYGSENFAITDSSGKDLFSSTIFNIRKNLDANITSLHNPQSAALLKGLLIGDRSEISDDINTQFINSGVMHVIAISGQHVAYILVIFILLFGRFNIYTRSFFTVLGLLFFLFMTGVSPSVFRAVVMALVVITGYLTNRSVNGYNAIAVSAIILLLIDPNTLFDPGFQLSYTAVLGMMTFGSYFVEQINKLNIKNKLLKGVLYLVFVSVAAQIGTLPLSLFYFGKLSVIGLLANIIIVPLSGIIISIGIFTLILAPVWNWGALCYAAVNDYLIFAVLWLVKVMGDWKYSFIAINQFNLTGLISTFFFIGFLILTYKYIQSKIAKVLIILLVTANIFVFSSIDKIDYLPENKLSVIMIDVGQGDAFLIRFPNGKTALVDAGDANQYFDNGRQTILPLLQKLGIQKIDFAFLSHPESDHFGGFVSLIQDGKIAQIFKTKCDSSVKADLLFEKFCLKHRVSVNYYNSFPLAIGNTKIYFLINDEGAKLKSNDRSGIIKLQYGSTSFLFTGDIERKGEEMLINKYGSFLNCTVLKIPHHGSKTGSSYEFLKLAAPQFAVVSAGRGNRFNHPSEETINRLRLLNINTCRTDREGAVFLVSDGKNITKMEGFNKF